MREPKAIYEPVYGVFVKAHNVENIWVIYKWEYLCGFRIMCGLMWVFCEWTSKIKARKFVPQQSFKQTFSNPIFLSYNQKHREMYLKN